MLLFRMSVANRRSGRSRRGKAKWLVPAAAFALCLGLGVIVLVRAHVPSDTPGSVIRKADQPISAELRILGKQQPGGRVTLSLTATTQVPADDVELLLDVPEALFPLAGGPSWKGSLGKGEDASLQMDVLIPDDAFYEVRAAAVARFPNAKAVAVADAAINPAARAHRARHAVSRNSRGEPIIDFPANTRVRSR